MKKMRRMKKGIAVAAAAALGSVSILPVYAENGTASYEEQWQAIRDYQEEIAALTDYEQTIHYWMTSEEQTIQMDVVLQKDDATWAVSAAFGEAAEAGVDAGIADSMVQIGIVNQDGLYLNVEDLVSMMEKLMSEADSSTSYEGMLSASLAMFGVTQDWLYVPSLSGIGTVVEDAMTLGTDVMDAVLPCYNSLPVEEIEGGYAFSLTASDLNPVMPELAAVYGEHIGDWMDQTMALINQVDVREMAKPYIEALLAGLRAVNSELVTAEEEEALYAQLDELKQEMSVEDSEELAEAKTELQEAMTELPQMYQQMVDAGMTLDLSMQQTKNADGSYSMQLQYDVDLSQLQGMTDDAEEIDEEFSAAMATGKMSMLVTSELVPADQTIEVPSEYDHVYDVIESAGTMLYSIYALQSSSSSTEQTVTVEEGQEGTVAAQEADSSTYLDGNRYLVDYYGEGGAWLTFDDTVLSVDTENSDSDLVFLDVVNNYNYQYLTVSCYSYGTLEEQFQSMREYYEENYSGSWTDVTSFACGDDTIQVGKVDYTYSYDDGSSASYTMYCYGTDLSDEMYLYGDVNIDPTYETEEEALRWIQAAFMGMETVE